MTNNVKDRLISFLEEQGISKSEFGRRIGVSSAFVTSMRKSMQPDKIRIIQQEFPDLNTEWLLTGEGEMLKDVESVETEENRRLIPFYDTETTGGFNGHVASSEEEVHMTGYIEAGGWFDSKETAAIRHVGDSMIEYPSGCVLAVREVHDRRLLVPGRNYVIETSEYRVRKRYQLGKTPGTISLYSTNQEKYPDGRFVHEPFDLPVEEIRRVYRVLGYIVNESGEFRLIK